MKKVNPKYQLISPRQVRPQHFEGVDYGADSFILARKGNKVLLRQGGNRYWAGLGEFNYSPASLEFYLNLHDHHQQKILDKSGQRLSRKLLESHLEKIRELFNEPELKIEDLLNFNSATLVLPE